jgi:soluble lytic murein transglycosylase-like protein
LKHSRLIAISLLPFFGPITDTFLTLPAPNVEPKTSSEKRKIINQVQDAAREHHVDPALVLSVMNAESRSESTAKSPAGAIGLMQVMPKTARALGYDVSRWDENIEAGAHYLGQLLEKYRDRPNAMQLATAAYNAGPATVDRYNGVPPYPETRTFVRRVLTRYWEIKREGMEPALAD